MEPHDGKQVEEKQRGPIFPDQCPDADLGGLDLISLLRGGPSSHTSSTLSIQRQFVLSGPARSVAHSPVDTLLDQDRSSPWSGFEEVLPHNQEARPRSPTVLHTEPALPLSPSMPPSHHSQSQPPSDPMMAMFRSLMSSFLSELKTLRSDLSGSMSTMVAEAVAAHLPQVPYQFQTKFFMYLFIVHMMPICSPYNCYTLHTISRLLKVVIVRFLSPTSVRLLQNHLLQSCPWPHHPWDHPHRWCP